MRLQRIIMKNYRQYLDFDISLSPKNGGDLHVVIAENGVGKSNTINAISWCLYDKEPNLDNSDVFPRLNQLCYCGDDISNKKITVSVTLLVEIASDHTVEYCRTEDYIVLGVNKYRIDGPSKLTITELTSKESIVCEKPEETLKLIKQFIPEEIADYYLFDGEKLDTYFKETKATEVKIAVSTISQVKLMNIISKKLDTLGKNFIKEAGKNIDAASKISSDIEKNTISLETYNEEYESKKLEYKVAVSEIEKLSAALEGTPDIAKLEADRTTFAAMQKKEKDIMENKRKEKADILFDYYIRLTLAPYLKELKNIIVEKKESGEIPVINDRTLIEDILHKSQCSICGQKLSSEAQQYIAASLDKYKLPGAVSLELNELKPTITSVLDLLKKYPDQIQKLNDEISSSIETEKKMGEQVADIESSYSIYKTGNVKENQEKRKKYEGIRDKLLIKIGSLEGSIELLNKELKRLDRLREDILNDERVKNDARMNGKICTDALDVLKKAENMILTDIRKDIQSRTNDIFRQLIWKEKTYDHVEIDENYNLLVISQTNESVRGSLSAAEKEFLALAFTMALHEVSGFSAPLIIDTPVSRVSGKHRASFGRYLALKSKEKQIILLFTQDEYSENIRNELEPHVSNKFTYTLAENEKRVIVTN